MQLKKGDKAPDFTLKDNNDENVSLSDFAGKKVVLYFYPQAETPGCTKEACDFRDSLNPLKSAGYQVIGVSPDITAKLKKFVEKRDLNFPLLADEDHKVAEKYGAWGTKKNYGKEYVGLIRSTFVIDGQGKIEIAQYNVRATGHVSRLRKELRLS